MLAIAATLLTASSAPAAPIHRAQAQAAVERALQLDIERHYTARDGITAYWVNDCRWYGNRKFWRCSEYIEGDGFGSVFQMYDDETGLPEPHEFRDAFWVDVTGSCARARVKMAPPFIGPIRTFNVCGIHRVPR